MKGHDRPRAFEFSSLVMGGKDIHFSSFPTKPPPALNSAKMFPKKGDLGGSKYSKIRSMKVRTRNERPDIFLEGEQLTKTTAAWHQQMDVNYIEGIRDKMRRSTHHSLLKNPSHIRKTPAPRSTPTEFRDQSSCACVLNVPKKVSNTFTKTSLISCSKRMYSTERQNPIRKEMQQKRERQERVEQKVMRKTELKLNQSAKVADQFKRKQLFYLTQKDLAHIKSQIFIVVEHPSGQIVTGSYYKRVVEIASLTKIMTFYTVVKIIQSHLREPEKEVVVIDSKAADMSGTSAELLEGDQYTVKELLYGLMLPSGNDAGMALARWGGAVLGGDSKDFIIMMNKLSAEIGMKSSSFGNPHGLPHPQNGSTAEDLGILIGKCLQYDIFRQVIKCKVFRCWTENAGVKRQVSWQNTQKLLRRPGFQGVKTGVTVAAGPCLASLYTKAGRTFIVVVLRTNKLSRRFKETRWLLRMCLRRMNYDGSFQTAVGELGQEDPELDSDNSEQEQQFYFDRNDLVELDRRRRIIMNQL